MYNGNVPLLLKSMQSSLPKSSTTTIDDTNAWTESIIVLDVDSQTVKTDMATQSCRLVYKHIRQETTQDTFRSLSLLHWSLSDAFLCNIAYFYTVHSHQKSIGSYHFMTRIIFHCTRLPAICTANKVQLTILKSFISSNFSFKKGSILPPFLYSVEYLITAQHNLHI